MLYILLKFFEVYELYFLHGKVKSLFSLKVDIVSLN